MCTIYLEEYLEKLITVFSSELKQVSWGINAADRLGQQLWKIINAVFNSVTEREASHW